MTGYDCNKIATGYVLARLIHAWLLTGRIQAPNYETCLNQIVAVYQTHAEGKDRTFSRFLLDLPEVPQDVLNLLRESCVEPEPFVSSGHHGSLMRTC